MRIPAIFLFLAAIKLAAADLLPPTNEPSCSDNIDKPCTGKGLLECCEVYGFVYCGWTNGTWAFAPCQQSWPNCNTYSDIHVAYCHGTVSMENGNVAIGADISRIGNLGDVIGNPWQGSQQAGSVLWNVMLDTTGYVGDVP
jgi:hypothetical protein